MSLRAPILKPALWTTNPGIVAYNCQKAGVPHPVLAMPFWEGAGNLVRDYSGRGNHGTLMGGLTWEAEWLDFDGSNSYVEIPHHDSIDPSYISISVWFVSDRHVQYQELLRKGDNVDVESYEFILGYPASDDIRFSIYDNNQWRHGGPVAINTGQLYHIVGTYDGSYVRLYLDGAEVGTPLAYSGGAIGGSTDILNIARRSDGSRYFQGKIKNISIFDVGISAAQVKTLYYNPYFMYQTPEELYGYVAGAPPVGNPFWYYNMLKRRNA